MLLAGVTAREHHSPGVVRVSLHVCVGACVCVYVNTHAHTCSHSPHLSHLKCTHTYMLQRTVTLQRLCSSVTLGSTNGAEMKLPDISLWFETQRSLRARHHGVSLSEEVNCPPSVPLSLPLLSAHLRASPTFSPLPPSLPL